MYALEWNILECKRACGGIKGMYQLQMSHVVLSDVIEVGFM